MQNSQPIFRSKISETDFNIPCGYIGLAMGKLKLKFINCLKTI